MRTRSTIGVLAGLIPLLLLMVEPACAGAALDRIRSSGVLVVATDPDWPPVSWRKADGAFAGFDVDVAMEIAHRMGVGIRFYMPYSFEAVLAGDWGGKWDMATSVTPTAQRAEHVTFAGVYWYTVSSLAVHLDNTTIREPVDASGKRIGVVRETEYEKYLTREPFDIIDMPTPPYKIDSPQIVRFNDRASLYRALAKGDGVEVDAIVDAMSTLLQGAKDGVPLKISGVPLLYTPDAIAIDRGDPELADFLKGVIDGMLKDGTLPRLSMKWFDFDVTHR